ncbi:carbohydrate ABC transporter permease [Paenibacillus eucommiae]|uniref:Aldouronate transport system permease protein n=1 Tax=Paenibacillus eucommiae TaxID=1355755 RepID=A0ABS4ISH2_9BACL|nr:carbohydrate ABC transporter permease [Paenibacillus eucommiae]MBP1990516.1 putative aldouronate transport system permease protein [Paenibacillus eucommiae]
MKHSMGEKLFIRINAGLLILIALSCLLPLLHIAALSLSDQQSIMSGIVTLWPLGWSFESYRLLLVGTNVVQAFQNSMVITVVGVALSLVFTVMAAYPLSRKGMYGRRFFTLGIVFTMLFSGGLIPSYLVVKSLGLMNHYGALWLPVLVNTFNMLVMRTFFENIPDELEEAARMDGSGEWRFLLRIVLPLSMPVMATIGLFYAVSYWNSFFSLLLFIQNTDKYNLAVLVQQMIQSQSILQEINNMRPGDQIQATPEGIKSAGIMVMIIPMLVVYPFLQKYFIQGVMIGAIKG